MFKEFDITLVNVMAIMTGELNFSDIFKLLLKIERLTRLNLNY